MAVAYAAVEERRAGLVTGGSSGIGLAIARVLAEEGHALTLVARTPERLEEAADQLRAAGADVLAVVGNMASEDDIREAARAHRERFGRLDVLVNNAGASMGAPIDQVEAKRVDVQLDVNVRAIVLMYRECAELLRAAGGEHGNALVVNLSSVAGKSGQPWVSVYSATKAAVIGFTQAMNKELSASGVKSCALCPGFVDTPFTDFVKGQVPAEQMIRPDDVAEIVRTLLRLSPACLVPEVVLERPQSGF